MIERLTVRWRLLLMIAVSCLTILAMGVIGLFGLYHMSTEVNLIYLGGLDDVLLLRALESETQGNVASVFQKFGQNMLSAQESSVSLREAQAELQKIWEKYRTTTGALSEGRMVKKQDLMERIQQSLHQLNGFIDRALEVLKRPEDRQLNGFTPELYEISTPLLHHVNELIALHGADTDDDYRHSQETTAWLQTLMFMSMLGAFLVLIPLSLAISRSISKPLEYVSRRLETRDTEGTIEITSGGELGVLLTALGRMFFSLEQIKSVLSAISAGDLTVELAVGSKSDTLGNALQNMISNMRQIIGDIQTEVNTLAASSEEIMTTLSHISTGANETATAVTETTTTTEELKQTANISVEKAKDVLANAQETVQAVSSSGQSVSESIKDMNQIRDRMQTISDTILKLSEKGLAIAQIMDTVNDIAEQSNLLAVNAAIEATKAGEHGRSFNVVAQEIRTLAEQSKNATVQVRALLNDIQNATSAAVLATEQGAKAVAKGVEQSLQTNKTMSELSGRMAAVTQAANQIVLSNQQQLVGTEQITIAMSQINRASTDHVNHLKQISEALETLNQVGSALKGLTDQYKLPIFEKRQKMKIPTIKIRAQRREETFV